MGLDFGLAWLTDVDDELPKTTEGLREGLSAIVRDALAASLVDKLSAEAIKKRAVEALAKVLAAELDRRFKIVEMRLDKLEEAIKSR